MSDAQRDELDVVTLMAIGVVVYLIKNVVHEGLGHGVACVLVGGKPVAISSAWWDGTFDGVSAWGRRGERAAGTVANLLLGVALLPAWRALASGPRVHLKVFVWLLVLTNLFSGAGYLMVDPIAHFGDWSAFLEGLEPALLLRIVAIATGAAVSAATLRFAVRSIDAFIGFGEAERKRRARLLCWAPYLIGGLAFTLAGLMNPYGPRFALTSALATFGGTAFLAWLPAWVKGPGEAVSEAVVRRSPAWLTAGAASAVILIVLGRGISF